MRAGGRGEMRTWAWWLALVAAAAVRARELDPAACGARFDVQRDKIIRTEESREMGARYLSELDVGARRECLRLCCETDACDVFVYEEKSPGSCYLFKCGPPEDFRCKFTQHSNFSSGVLAMSRRLAELQDQERLARVHVDDSFRSPSSTTTSTTSTTVAAPTRAPEHPPDPILPPPRRCSRYQFECHTGGECIAVYNACDGVPQCADGSDEAPELGCPRAAPPAPPPPPRSTLVTTTTTLSSPLIQVQESGERALNEAAGELSGAERWPHRLTQAQPPRNTYSESEGGSAPHIFSHKGGLVQAPAAAVPHYAPFDTAWPRTPWVPPPGMEGGWSGGYPRAEWGAPDPRRAWPVPQPPRPEPDVAVYMAPKTMPELPMYTSQQQTLRDSPKKGFELSKRPPSDLASPAPPAPPAPDLREEKPALAPTPSTDNKTKKVVVEDMKARHVESAAHAAPAQGAAGGSPGAVRDGLSDHPPAAVLLLVLGILMTAAMGVMVGCRARAARRRLRRGKSPYAHDADYLVNGMYL